jgi:YVTN family beta-propeller protein
MRDDLQVSGGRAATAKQPPRRITLRIRVSIGLAVLVGATLASVPMATDAFASGPTITALTFGGSPSSPTVTVWGSGFGTYADLGTPQPAGGTYDCVSPPYSGSDYQNNMYFNENSQAWAAGQGSGGGGDCIGLIISSYSDSQITFTFGSGYSLGGYGAMGNGDGYSITVMGTTFNGTVAYPASPQTGTGPFAYVADSGSNTVSVVDTTDNTVVGSPITVGTGPEHVAISPNGKDAFVTVSNGTVAEIDTTTNAVVNTVSVVDPQEIAVSPDGQTVWVTGGTADGELVPIDVATATVGTPITVGSGAGALAISPDGTKAYVVTSGSSVVPVDLVTRTAGTSISTDLTTGPFQLEMSPTGSTVYFGGFGVPPYETLIPISVGTNTTGTPIYACHYDNGQFVVSPGGTTAWVACSGSGSVDEVDLSTGFGLGTYSLGQGPVDTTGSLAVSPDGETVYVDDTTTNVVVPFDVTSLSPSADIPLSGATNGIAVTPDQGPTASLAATTSGGTTTFDATTSVPDTSPIVSYSWNFGDSDTAVTSAPVTTHTYAAAGSYTATVTETDAAGTSTTEDYTGQTASLVGSASAEASAAVAIATAPCTAQSSGPAAVSAPATPTSPAQSVTVTAPAPSQPSQSLTVTSGPGQLACKSKHFKVVDGVTSYSSTFTPTTNVTVTDLITGPSSTRGIKICFEGLTPPPTYLKKCAKISPEAPCATLAVVAGGVQATILVRPGDPRFHIDGVQTLTEEPNSVGAKGVIGKTITIKGTDLLGSSQQTPPIVAFTSLAGSTIAASISSASATAIVVHVPNGAATGPLTVAWPNETLVSDASIKIT